MGVTGKKRDEKAKKVEEMSEKSFVERNSFISFFWALFASIIWCRCLAEQLCASIANWLWPANKSFHYLPIVVRVLLHCWRRGDVPHHGHPIAFLLLKVQRSGTLRRRFSERHPLEQRLIRVALWWAPPYLNVVRVAFVNWKRYVIG